MKKVYHFQSNKTGVIVASFPQVVKEFAKNLFEFGFLDIVWKYSKRGF